VRPQYITDQRAKQSQAKQKKNVEINDMKGLQQMYENNRNAEFLKRLWNDLCVGNDPAIKALGLLLEMNESEEQKYGKALGLLLEVNVEGEEQKYGAMESETEFIIKPQRNDRNQN
jgi:hypothetical protein